MCKKILIPSRYEKAKYWTKLVSVTGFAQVIVQVVSFASGILVIRLLPVEEYALYTIANTMLGTISVLSDGGISTGVMARGGKVWQDKQRLGAVLATGMYLRRRFALFSLLVSIPILCYLLLHNGASLPTVVLISISLIPAFYASLSDGLLQIPVKLHQAITPLQRNQINVAIGRMALTGITLFAFPWAFVAIVASGIPRIWGNTRLRRIADKFVENRQDTSNEEKKEIVKIVKKILPTACYYSISSQIPIWIISILGMTSTVAQLGAISRLSILFSVFTNIFGHLVIPRFSRLIFNKKILIIVSVRIITGSIVTILIVFFLVFLFSDQILMLLGHEYMNLKNELILSFTVSGVSLLGGISFSLYSSRGWIIAPLIIIGLDMAAIITGLFIFDVSTLTGVLKFNIFTSTILFLINTLFLYMKIFENDIRIKEIH